MPRGNIFDRAEEVIRPEYCEAGTNPYIDLARELQNPEVIKDYEKEGSEAPSDFG